MPETVLHIERIKIKVKEYFNKNAHYAFDQDTLAMFTTDELEHIIEIGTSILCTKWDLLEGGSFVRAVVDNDLMKAVGKADETNVKALKFYCMLIYNLGYIE